MEQRKLNDQANTLVDLAKVSLFHLEQFKILHLSLYFYINCFLPNALCVSLAVFRYECPDNCVRTCSGLCHPHRNTAGFCRGQKHGNLLTVNFTIFQDFIAVLPYTISQKFDLGSGRTRKMSGIYALAYSSSGKF